ncbi:MAG: hypothetical protein UX29_C0001G0081 [Parcubacteria group bacterium GW2011_GWA2_46_10]|nr:MAG: hypothetical protein UX29_C0001G0081 [Parcubacteria group bacterium GW2011_GWA2_46_10]
MKTALTTKTSIIILPCFILIGLAVFVVVLGGNKDVIGNQDCVTGVEERIVRGSSLTGLVEDGETVQIYFGYYKCNEVQREDIVIYNYAGDTNPIIKVVKGIAGDKFDLEETAGDGWHILINGGVLKNSEGQPYLIDGKGFKMLSLYSKDYDHVIPDNAYLIMGNQVNGSTDSTRFGLVHKDDFLGMVLLRK